MTPQSARQVPCRNACRPHYLSSLAVKMLSKPNLREYVVSDGKSNSGRQPDPDALVRVWGVFYKYREFPADCDTDRWAWLDNVFLRNEIYFAAPSSLNDPFDCYPRIELPDDPAKTRNLAQKMVLEVLATRGIQLTAAQIRRDDFQRELTSTLAALRSPSFRNETLFNTIDSATGIFCMSNNNDNILQWSYYGGGHSGFCLEFNVPETATMELTRFRRHLIVRFGGVYHGEEVGPVHG